MIDVNIYRYNPETDKFPYTQTYSIKKPEKDIMLLELLSVLKEKDSSISYRPLPPIIANLFIVMFKN